MKNLIFTLLFLFSFSANASEGPNEKVIYFHIHQASQWAKNHYKKKTVHAPYEMGIHLGKLKYSEERLVDSKFYKEFQILYRLIHDFNLSTPGKIETILKDISTKAKELKLSLPENWEREFGFSN